MGIIQCADIIFTANPPELTSKCANSSGIGAEPISGNGSTTDNNGSGASGVAATIRGLVGAVIVAAVVGML